MSVSFDLFVPGTSWLHRLDPRVKLLLSAAITLLLFLWPRPAVIAPTLVGLHLLLLAAGVPWPRLRWVWLMMLPLHVFVPLAWFLLQPVGEVFAAWGPFRLSWGGAWHGLWAVIRLDALAFAAFLWIFTTDPAQILRTFLGLRLPYMGALILALSIRYLPTVAGLYEQIRDAQQARGLVLDEGPWLRRMRARLPILVAVVIGTLRLAQALGWALETRALGATLPQGRTRTTWRPLRMTRGDRLALAILVFAIMIMLGIKAINVL